MSATNPTDDEIRQCNGVVLFDHARGWQDDVGAATYSSASRSARFLRIPVDSTDEASVESWRERIIGIRGPAPTE